MLLAAACMVQTVPGCSKAQNREGPVVDRAHIEQVIHSLPPESQMRVDLEHGAHGDGIRYPWMDIMKNLGVQRSKIVLDFAWKGRPADIKVQRILFFKTYDTNCSQITDPEHLQRIAKTELEAKLKEFSVATTAKSDWTYFEHRPRASHGIAILEVLDDEWLPANRPNLLPSEDGYKTTRIAIEGDVEHLQQALKSHDFSQPELDRVLRDVAAHLDDACSIKPLVEAGANPNSQDGAGQTPLWIAAYAGRIHNTEALLNLGADPKIKTFGGETALDIAQKRGHSKIVSLLQQRRP
jgi:hypothetical protein